MGSKDWRASQALHPQATPPRVYSCPALAFSKFLILNIRFYIHKVSFLYNCQHPTSLPHIPFPHNKRKSNLGSDIHHLTPQGCDKSGI